MATWSDSLVRALDEEGIEAVIDDAEDWIPNETGWSTDRQVSKLLKQAVRGFDLVHAWGYRSAWACSEAFYLKFPWVYTAYDTPKTTHSLLIDRLNAARAGLCSSRSIRSILGQVDTVNLEIVTPCRTDLDHVAPREDARRLMGWGPEELIVLGVGRLIPDRGFGSVAAAMPAVRERLPQSRLILMGEGPEEDALRGAGAEILPSDDQRFLAMRGADLVVVPSRRSGFSMVAAEAMLLESPVLLRRTGGLPEMGMEDVNIAVFDHDEELGLRIIEWLEAPIRRESLGKAARYRALEGFDPESGARQMARIYRDLLAR